MKNTGKKSKVKSQEKKIEQPKEENKKGGTHLKDKNAKSPKNNKEVINNKNSEEMKKKEEEKKKLPTFNLVFIYRREKYTLKNLVINCLLSKIKKLISNKISADLTELKFFYKEKELKFVDDNKNVFEMIKGDNTPFFEVKKEPTINENITSLNTNINLNYQVKCEPVSDYADLIKKVQQFFKDICLEAHFLCEPTSPKSYNVCLSCSDHCFQFKRYMMNIAKTDNLYKETEFIVVGTKDEKKVPKKVNKENKDEKSPNKVNEENKDEKVEPKNENKNVKKKEEKKQPIKLEKLKVTNINKNKKPVSFMIEYRKQNHIKDDFFQKDFINVGPFESCEEINKKNFKNYKNKKLGKKDFSPYFKYDYK